MRFVTEEIVLLSIKKNKMKMKKMGAGGESSSAFQNKSHSFSAPDAIFLNRELFSFVSFFFLLIFLFL